MKLPRTLFLQVFWPFLALILISLAVTTWLSVESMRAFHRDDTFAMLETRARLIEREIGRDFPRTSRAALNALCKEIGAWSKSRVTIVLPSGDVVGDSAEDPAEMENHADRPEIMDALAGRVGRELHYSHTLGSDSVYVAIPVRDRATGEIVAAIRTSQSLASVEQTLRRVYAHAALGTAVVAVLAALVALVLTRRVGRPLKRMVAETQHLADGDFASRLHVPRSAELAELAGAMNHMAAQLRERIATIDHQRSELDAVLSSMAEGVIAVDMNERILSINPAAARMLEAKADLARGRDVQEIVRNPKFLSCIERMLGRFEPFQDELVLAGPTERYVYLSASGLRDQKGKELGVLFVLQDITNLRRLERARSDFIANVSHEIRTPVTSIKGYAETLLAEGKEDPDTMEQFLGIIARQADRLSALVDDTLSLASLERSESLRDIALKPLSVQSVIDAAVHVCAPRAADKNICITVTCPEGLTLNGNEALLEQAIVNLMDNAVKYSHADSQIVIEAVHAQDEICVRVQDFGMGISPEHLPRLFERFYRVDSARSRKLGGTGLGLAIVKHIVTLHGGTVTVQSAVSKGSCFTVHFPIKTCLP